MKKEVVLIVADKNYINHAKSLFANIKTIGNWLDDFCLLTNMNDEDTKIFRDKGIYVKQINMNNPYYVKFNIFDDYFKQWNKVMYIDCDFLINKSLDIIKNLKEDDMYCDGEEFKILETFTMWDSGVQIPMTNTNHLNKYSDILRDLKENFKTEINGYNSGFMYFNTKIINDSVKKLNDLKYRFKDINHHVGYVEGTDQPIINLLFNKWTQIPNNYVSFWKRENFNSVAVHYCHWDAPWTGRYQNVYQKYISNLKLFDNLKFYN